MADAPVLHWLALGDSYTFGTGATSAAHRWPDRVARHMESRRGGSVLLTNLGVAGWTTQQIIDTQAPHLDDRPWDVVSVLAGVNDEYQGVDATTYRRRIERLHELIAARRPGRVLALSLPDYSFTPLGGATKAAGLTVARLHAFNAMAAASAARHGFTWIDLFEVSRTGMADASWVASDGLHPADAQYARWADHIASRLPAGL
ncbi:MAG: SGNH/GDSL hydrolase family protein [Candidatus Dormibacteria bacterium]